MEAAAHAKALAEGVSRPEWQELQPTSYLPRAIPRGRSAHASFLPGWEGAIHFRDMGPLKF